jgi:hypothetical protein
MEQFERDLKKMRYRDRVTVRDIIELCADTSQISPDVCNEEQTFHRSCIWDGASWFALGSGIVGNFSAVLSLSADTTTGDLYVGGFFV